MRALSRKIANRKSTLRNLATSLVLYERITTTVAKAKELKPVVEHLINKARPMDLSSRRRLLAYLFDENATKKVLEILVPRFKDTPTGFIKSYRLRRRLGDGAEMMILEFQKEEVKTIVAKDKVPQAEEKTVDIKDENANIEKTGRATKGRTTKTATAKK